MRFPVTIEHRRFMAKIYGNSDAYPFYRVVRKACAKRVVRSLAEFSEAKAEAEAKVRQLANGRQPAAISSRNASVAIAIRDAPN